ncbi:Scr1 family TA system antitoxin-like transcriptional regulator [Streptomyces sp. DSM 41886]|uniref:Scr1 family TA system antitoxin-like transcriptional regulator n=1 Tax=Streptomyces johnsoniae TaxID=3075532 RepID=A0ABU2S415_9ACTN|nr:Scr1 family TA system antitoxin-like transcriptional regulator [Streptomyces sp. DSM 41886]MDT0443717.1 Scr1 family TA system antitoxin-like transcriptional regulator [Streptomyces sp. DSM 41886]
MLCARGSARAKLLGGLPRTSGRPLADLVREPRPPRRHPAQGHRLALLVEESVLHYRLGDSAAMAAQLGYLLTAGALPAVSLGVIPADLPDRAIRPLEAFHVYDDTLVAVELLTARVTVTQPSEVALYLRAFQQLRELAVYGADARALILRAIEGL